ncbi:amino acid deaminase [Nocardia miyunensis]|uniref:amino acid deaminase n=1 Tax=Nocardia miyunensis TaxID=282684 RepID=UPI00082E2532|nr:amino acid deaminase [Nocardia miyunensis]
MTLQSKAFHELANRFLDHTYKGVPLGATVRVSDVGNQGWNVANGDTALPVTTLRRRALDNNLRTMADYCSRSGALFAPHGKTTMSPQLFAKQLEAGAWGMTAATPSQVATMRTFGVPRIIMANELSDIATINWIVNEMCNDPEFDFFSLIDSVAAITMIDAAIAATGAEVTFKVLLEVGLPGGRAGIRTTEDALAVAEAVHGSSHLLLGGVETYEGLVTSGGACEDIAAVDAHFDRVRHVVELLMEHKLFGTETIIVTAGGSSYFDRVVAKLSDWSGSKTPTRLVLRSGCYLSHDVGKYHSLSPLDGRRAADEQLRLENALEAWGSVISRPEPGIAIVGSGKRDVPYDVNLPTVLRVHHRDRTVSHLGPDTQVYKVMDQHAFIRLAPDQKLDVGDVMVFGLSHPCTAFDKSRFVPIIDDDFNIVDAVLTFF